MNKAKVILHLVAVIAQRFPGTRRDEIEKELLHEGWPIGAIREAFEDKATF